MAWLAVSGIFTQYHSFGDTFGTDSYIKFYSSQTNNPINMATDNTGATQLAKAKIDANGFITTDAGAPFIPHIEEDYNLLIYQNATDADANLNPVKTFNNISNALSELSTTNANVATNSTNIATNAANIQDNADAITTLIADTDASTLNGQNAAFYQNADNINAGTLNADRLPTTGIQASTLGGALQDDAFFRNATNINAGTLDSARLPAGEGGGIDADLFRGSDSDFYRNASNLAFGTVPLARLPQGVGAGMDADLLDGQQGSYYLDLGNATGTINSTDRIGAVITGANIASTNSINGSFLLDNTVKAEKLQSAGGPVIGITSDKLQVSGVFQEWSRTFNAGINETQYFKFTTAGEYAFFPTVRFSTAGIVPNICLTFIDVDAGQVPDYLPSGSAVKIITLGHMVNKPNNAVTGVLRTDMRYFLSSPPYALGNIDMPYFIFIKHSANDDEISLSHGVEPPWSSLLERPVKYGPNHTPYERDYDILEEAKKYKDTDINKYFDLLEESKTKLKLRTVKDKNRHMNELPHNFCLNPGETVSLLVGEPKDFEKLQNVKDSGEPIANIIKDHISLGEEVIQEESPRGVTLRRFKFKNTK